MVYDLNHFPKPGWRSFCTATLIHHRVLTTAGLCVEGIEAQMAPRTRSSRRRVSADVA